MVRSFLSLAVATLCAGSVLAQVAPPAAGQPARPGAAPIPAAEAPQAYHVKQLLGTKVSLKGDVSIGTVDDVVFADNGQVEYLIVANDGKMVTVPWEAAKFDFGKRTAMLNISQEQYQAIPTYTTTEYPTYFEPGYRTRAYGWYGLKPRPWGGFRR
jgi:PRC-barrel domain